MNVIFLYSDVSVVGDHCIRKLRTCNRSAVFGIFNKVHTSNQCTACGTYQNVLLTCPERRKWGVEFVSKE